MDRITAMNAFVRVVEAGTFTKVAGTLDVPSATVSRLIQGGSRGPEGTSASSRDEIAHLTAEGATYYERVVRLLADSDDIECATRSARGKPTGKCASRPLRDIDTRVIVPPLAEFYREHPDVEIEIGAGNWHTDLVAKGIDCGMASDLGHTTSPDLSRCRTTRTAAKIERVAFGHRPITRQFCRASRRQS